MLSDAERCPVAKNTEKRTKYSEESRKIPANSGKFWEQNCPAEQSFRNPSNDPKTYEHHCWVYVVPLTFTCRSKVKRSDCKRSNTDPQSVVVVPNGPCLSGWRSLTTGPVRRPPVVLPGHLFSTSYGSVFAVWTTFLTAPDHLRFWVDRHPALDSFF